MSQAQPLQRILLIDDNLDDRAWIIQRLIQEFPELHVEEITNADSLNQAIASPTFELVITEYELVWNSGLDVLRRIKAQVSDCPVIMVAQCDRVDVAVEAMKSGLNDYIVKSPANLSRLLQAIRAAWSTVQTRRQAVQSAIAVQESQYLTALKRTEDALRQVRQRYHTLVNSLDSIVWEVDPQTLRFTFVSQQAEKILGYPSEQWLELDFWISHLHPDDRDASVQYCMTTTQDHRFEYRMIAADGRVVWIEDIVTVVTEHHQTVKLVGLMIDISERKRQEAERQAAEVALQKSEEQRRLALELTNTGSWDVDLTTGEAIWSESEFRLLGLEPGTIATTHQAWCDRVHADDLDRVERAAAQALQNHTLMTVEYRVVHPDGSVHWVLEKARGIYDASGQPVRLVGVLMDVSDRKQAEDILSRAQESLQEREALFQEITKTVSQMVFVRSATSRQFLYVSPAYETIWGRSCESLYQHPESWLDSVHPDDLPIVLNSVSEQFANNPATREYRIVRPDGEIRWIFAQINPIQDETGNPDRFVGFAADITERKHLEIALQASQQRYQTLVENSPDIIERFDTQLRHLYVSPSLTQITGIPAADFLGKTCRELEMPEAMTNTWEAAAQVLLATGQKQIVEFETPTLDGVRSFEMAIAPELTHDNAIESMLCISRDVTARKASATYLRQQAERERLIRTVTERIRQSLDLDQILARTVAEVRQVLQTDRVVIFKLEPDGSGNVVQESVDSNWQALWGQTILDHCFRAQYIELYQQGRIHAIVDIDDGSIQPCHAKLLRQFDVRANLVVPIQQTDALWGLLIAHECGEPRQWTEEETHLLKQLADQVAIAIQQAQLYQQAQSELAERQRADVTLQRLNQELEQGVQKRTTQLSLALSAARMGTWEWDVVTNLEAWSPDMYPLLGLKTDPTGRVLDETGTELSPRPTFELFIQRLHPDDRERLQQTLQRALDQRSPYECEFRVILPDGSLHWRYSRGSYVLDEHGQPLRMIGVCMDISERKRVEDERKRTDAALRESEGRFSKAFRANPIPTAITTFPEGQFLDANDSYLKLFGYQPEELVGHSTQELDIWQNVETRNHFIQLLVQGSSLRDLEIEFRTKAGEVRHGILFLERIELSGRSCVLQMLYDISDRKRIEEISRQQARQEQSLRLITQEIRHSLNLESILATTVAEVRHLLHADRVAVYRFNADWSGQFIAESVAPGWEKLVDSDLQTVWEDTYLQETQGGRYRHQESFAVTDIQTVGHTPCHIELLEQFQAKAYAIAPICPGENLWGLLAVYQNSTPRQWQPWEMELLQQIAIQQAIAIQQSELYGQLQTELQERRQIEDQLRASLKEKEVLLREVYHRVKNNMQLVSSLLRLQMDTIQNPDVVKLFTESQRRVKTLALIHEKLYRSKNLSHSNFPAYVHDLVNDLIQSYTPAKAAIRATLEVADLNLDIDTAIPCGLIINELVSNALKYAFPKQRGEIELRFWLDNTGYYWLVVQDNGIGFPIHFNPQQADSLGMQLVYGLTEQLGGRVELERKGGSQFTIVFKQKP